MCIGYPLINVNFFSLVNHGIKPSQLSSFVFDGAYIKSHVDEELRKEFGFNADQLPVWWDWLHVCGLSGVY